MTKLSTDVAGIVLLVLIIGLIVLIGFLAPPFDPNPICHICACARGTLP